MQRFFCSSIIHGLPLSVLSVYLCPFAPVSFFSPSTLLCCCYHSVLYPMGFLTYCPVGQFMISGYCLTNEQYMLTSRGLKKRHANRQNHILGTRMDSLPEARAAWFSLQIMLCPLGDILDRQLRHRQTVLNTNKALRRGQSLNSVEITFDKLVMVWGVLCMCGVILPFSGVFDEVYSL